jgi:predicted phage baseplate assembly protein
MSTKPPLIDARTPGQIAEQTRQMLVQYLAQDYGWQAGDEGGEAGRALVGVFAHYCGQVIERINAAPERNMLAFLDLLGNSLTPPSTAEAPLSFFLDAAAPHGVAIPAGTPVQADPAEGTGEPVRFETVSDLWLSHFQLKAMDKVGARSAQPTDISGRILGVDSVKPGPLHKVDRIASGEALFDVKETLHFGLYLPEDKLPETNRPLSLYFFIGKQLYDPAEAPPPAEQDRPALVWEYLSGTRDNPQWKGLLVEDGTRGLTESGMVSFLLPADFSRLQRHLFEHRMYWIRAYLRSASAGTAGVSRQLTINMSDALYNPAPSLQGVSLHTVAARQGMTVRDEVLGSSNGNPGQVFFSFRRPVLEGQRVEVSEDSAARLAAGATWTPWSEVPDFHGSTPEDRHYVIDRQSGEIRFGDGQAGLIPPPGTRNVRLAAYRTGGGPTGDVPEGSLKSLVTAIRYVDKITNFAPAQGGAAGESLDSLVERAPKALRHRGRAVTLEDYEDLAKLASADVARALCVPLVDLTREPAKEILSGVNDDKGVGKVSVMVVPRSSDAKPLPSQTLLRHVGSYLRERASVGASIFVVGPLYLKVNVTVHVVLDSLSLENRVRLQVQEALAAFLHPLTGREGKGWPFGRLPQDSDLHRLLRQVPGISHVRRLAIALEVEQPPLDCRASDEILEVECVERTGRFLIHSGQHQLIAYPASA